MKIREIGLQKTPKFQNVGRKRKTLVLSLALFAAMSLPDGAFAQEGLFQRGISDEEYYGFGNLDNNRGLMRNGKRSTETGTINNQVFGQPAPLGSGVLILLGACAGYAVLKRKEDEQ